MTDTPWTLDAAVALCREIEAVCPKHGCHVALTGGTLYKDGPRKDADILFYRIRQIDAIDVDGLMETLRGLGVVPGEDYGWCFKATYHEKPIDFFFPERTGVDAPGYGPPPSLTPQTEADTQEILF